MTSKVEIKSTIATTNTPPTSPHRTSPGSGPGTGNRTHANDIRPARRKGSPLSIGPFRPKTSPPKSGSGRSKRIHLADMYGPPLTSFSQGHCLDIDIDVPQSSQKAQPGGQDNPQAPNVPSPPQKASPESGSLMVNNLSLNEKPRPFQPSAALSHKRCADSPSQWSKRTRHSGRGFKDSETDGSLPEPRGCDHYPTPPLGPKGETVTTWPRISPDDTRTHMLVDRDEDPLQRDTAILLEPETRPITQEHLINEVKGIYAGLVMVEKKCVEITQQRAKSATKLSNDQWQALIALHRTLLHEHHDFFLASQHPTASPALRRLANKYAMPARMWRHGIHSFLELLRQQLPDALDHMLAFVYIAYSMMALLKESVPSFRETWIECLGDLARYRMAIEDTDMRDRETWSIVARTWYNQAADWSPTVGRIQHHLAVLARPNIVQQLFFYTKALVSVVPFINARDSIMLLFSPLLEKAGKTNDRYSPTEANLVTACAYLFTRTHLSRYHGHAQLFVESLDGYIGRSSNKWKIQGPEVAASLIAGILDFGKDDNPVWTMYQEYMTAAKARKALPESADLRAHDAEDASIQDDLRRDFWSKQNLDTVPQVPCLSQHVNVPISSVSVTWLSLTLFASAIRVNANKIGDKNIVPFMSFVLSFLLSVAYVGAPLIYIESQIPWHSIITFLNTLGRSGVSDSTIEGTSFPLVTSGTGRQLSEDFYARGAIWAQHLFPADFFRDNVTDEDERGLELPSHTIARSERCLYLGIRLASFGRHIRYDTFSKQFALTEYASMLQKGVASGDALSTYVHRPVHQTLATLPPRSESTSLQTDVDSSGVQTLGAKTAETDAEYVVIDSVKDTQDKDGPETRGS